VSEGRRIEPSWLTPDWPAPRGVRALSTLRVGGVSLGKYASLNLGTHVGDEPAAVAANRHALRRAAHLPAEPAWLTQVHGVGIADLDADAAPGSPADGAVARSAGRVCAILTADCLPVLFACDSARVVGAAHAGWRGLAAGVLEATVKALGVTPETLLVWLGPGIGTHHFEVGAEVREAFVSEDPGAGGAFLENVRGRFMADLAALARRRLRRLGVERIYGGTECTHADAKRFFSHRRDGPTGRQATLIWMDPDP
jgi:YfiH family protein